MAIAFDNAAGFTGNVTSISSAYTTGSGANRYMVLFVGENHASPANHISSVLYNSVSAGASIIGLANAGNTQRISMFLLPNPSSGSNTVKVQTDGTTENLDLAVMTYSGVSQSATPDSKNSGAITNSQTITLATTVVASSCWLVYGCNSSNVVNSVTVASTQRVNNVGSTCNSTNFLDVAYDSNGTVGTGSQSTLLTECTTGANMLSILASLAPAAATTSVPELPLLGAG